MTERSRFLHFDNLDMAQPEIVSECSQCGKEFKITPKPSERIDEVLLRIRSEFEAHLCT